MEEALGIETGNIERSGGKGPSEVMDTWVILEATSYKLESYLGSRRRLEQPGGHGWGSEKAGEAW